VRVLTGEKLDLPVEFLPFLSNGAVDLMQPDICFAGGLTGLWRIAQLADLHHVPLTAHNIGSALQDAATAHFAAATPNFVMSETGMTAGSWRHDIIKQKMEIRSGAIRIPDGPGLGVTVREDELRRRLAEGEPWWD
jgi:L-alanine-DL-glutamate epimerase-like enolase superfamily enzyme